MAKSSVFQFAEDAAKRVLGGGSTPFNVGNSRGVAQEDDITIQSDTQGLSHQRYRQDLADKAAAAEAARQAEAARVAAQQTASQQAAAAAQQATQQQAAQTAATTAAQTQAQQQAAAAAKAKADEAALHKPMSLYDYDKWMTELSNQNNLKQLGYGNILFRDQSQGSWTSYLENAPKLAGHSTTLAGPVYNTLGSWSYNGRNDYGGAQNTMVDPVTGKAISGQYAGQTFGYGVAYRPQTGNQRNDWVTYNMSHGIQPLDVSQYTKVR